MAPSEYSQQARHRLRIAYSVGLLSVVEWSIEIMEQTVSDIPDAELLRRVVRSVSRNRPRRQEFAWAAVSDAFGLGSTYSAQLLRRFGLDPDSGRQASSGENADNPSA